MLKIWLAMLFLVFASSVSGLSVSYLNCSGEVVKLEGGGLGCVNCAFGSVWDNSSAGCVFNVSAPSHTSSGGFSLLAVGGRIFPDNPLVGLAVVGGVAFLLFKVLR